MVYPGRFRGEITQDWPNNTNAETEYENKMNICRLNIKSETIYLELSLGTLLLEG